MPDLSRYTLHRTVDDAEFEGVAVPGLSAEYLRHDHNGRIASVGRYRYGGREILLAWGYVDEEHCRYSAVCDDDGRWDRPRPGCPTVRVLRGRGRVTGFQVQNQTGRWIGSRDLDDHGPGLPAHQRQRGDRQRQRDQHRSEV